MLKSLFFNHIFAFFNILFRTKQLSKCIFRFFFHNFYRDLLIFFYYFLLRFKGFSLVLKASLFLINQTTNLINIFIHLLKFIC